MTEVTLEDVVGWLKSLPRERMLGDGVYCQTCALGAYLNRDGGEVVSVGLYATFDLGSGESLRELGPDEKFLRFTFDRVLGERDSLQISVGEFLDELGHIAHVTGDTRLMEALA